MPEDLTPTTPTEDRFTFRLARTPWGTPLYGNFGGSFGGDVLTAGLAAVPPEGLTRGDAEAIQRQMEEGVEQQWANYREEKKLEGRGKLGVAGIFELVPIGGVRVGGA